MWREHRDLRAEDGGMRSSSCTGAQSEVLGTMAKLCLVHYETRCFLQALPRFFKLKQCLEKTESIFHRVCFPLTQVGLRWGCARLVPIAMISPSGAREDIASPGLTLHLV